MDEKTKIENKNKEIDKKLKKKAQVGIEVLVILGILVIGAIIFGGYYLNQLKYDAEVGGSLDNPEFQPDTDPINPPITGDTPPVDICLDSSIVCSSHPECCSVSGSPCEITNSSSCTVTCCYPNSTLCTSVLAPTICGSGPGASCADITSVNYLEQCVENVDGGFNYYANCCNPSDWHNIDSDCLNHPACGYCDNTTCEDDIFWSNLSPESWFELLNKNPIFSLTARTENNINCPNSETSLCDDPGFEGDCDCTITPATECELGHVMFFPNPGEYYELPGEVILRPEELPYENCENIRIKYTTDTSDPLIYPEEPDSSHGTNYQEIPILLNGDPIRISARLYATDTSDYSEVWGPIDTADYTLIATQNPCDMTYTQTGDNFANAIKIETPKQLHDIGQNQDSLRKYYILCNNIDLNSTILSNNLLYENLYPPADTGEYWSDWYDATDGWIPIGEDSADGDLSFDGGLRGGNQYYIKNMYISRNQDNKDNKGLFRTIGATGIIDNVHLQLFIIDNMQNYIGALAGQNNGGTIIDSSVDSSQISARGNWVGGLVGNQSSGTITDTYFNGLVYTNGTRVGGLTGEITGGLIERCFVYGNVWDNNAQNDGSSIGNNDIGGFVGQASGGQIKKSYSYGLNVEARNDNGQAHIGGFVGQLTGSTIEDCYARSDVRGAYLGGFVGYIGSGSIVRAYSTGHVDVTASNNNNAGGFVGKKNGGSISNYSYWDTDTGFPTNNGGTTISSVIGNTTTQMNTTSTFNGGSYSWEVVELPTGTILPSTVWLRDSANINNGGYPYLSWQEYGRGSNNFDPNSLSLGYYQDLMKEYTP